MTFRASLNHKQASGVAAFYLHVSEPTDSSVAAVLLMRYTVYSFTDRRYSGVEILCNKSSGNRGSRPLAGMVLYLWFHERLFYTQTKAMVKQDPSHVPFP